MSEANWPWFHRSLGRMETERLLVDCGKDGCFLIRPSETKKGAYVLSLIHQQRIHHYRILPNDDCTLSVQAQEGVQQKRFSSLDGLVAFYGNPKRGIVCALTVPIGPTPSKEEEQQEEEEEEEAEDDESEEEADDEEVSVGGGGSGGGVDNRQTSTVSKYLLAVLPHIDLSSVDQEFQDRLKYYMNTSVAEDIQSMSTATPALHRLKSLLGKEVDSTHREVDKLFAQVDVLQNILDRVGGARQSSLSVSYRRSSPQDSGFDSLHYKLSECSAALHKLETTAFSTFKDLSAGPGSKGVSSLSQPSFHANLSDIIAFDVKTEQNIPGLGGKKNLCLKVDLKLGVLTISKPGEAGSTYQPYQVLQLIKSRVKETKLGVLFEGAGRKDYIFTNMQSREHFCQLIQSTRNRLKAYQDTDSLSIFVGSWNMGDSNPPSEIRSWFKSEGWGRPLENCIGGVVAHDIYVIGIQESALSEKEWIVKVKSILMSLVSIEYEKLDSFILWGIRLVILVKPEHSQKISHVQHSQVRTGIGNTLGNKGAVGISFYFNNTSFAFICCHLTSGTEKCHRRNQNYHDILKGMAPLKQKYISQFDLTHQFHHLFFFGDLNYRVALNSEDIISYAQRGNVHDIFCYDQLKQEMEKKRVFVGYEEAPIEFPPTYRFKKGERSMSSYVYIKKKRSGDRINEPSYCDRVLWKSYPGTRITNTSYGCTHDIMTSDHSPVFATFQIGGVKQHASSSVGCTSLSSSDAYIILQKCSAKILTNSKTQFYIEIHSTCFEGIRKTMQNSDFDSDTDGYLRPVWLSPDPILRIRPAVVEQGYLEQQHILLMLKSTDSDEPYAECCISLESVIGPRPSSVTRELIHQGMSVGELQCMLHVTLDQYNTKHSDADKDLYGNLDFIKSDFDDCTSINQGSSRVSPAQNGISSTSRTHRPLSGSDPHLSRTNRSSSTSNSRPPMPLPSERPSAATMSSTASRPPMPLPYPPTQTQKRQDPPPPGGLNTNSPSSSSRTGHGRPGVSPEPSCSSPTLPSHAPPVPTRRQNSRPPISEKPQINSLDAPPPVLKKQKHQPPVPMKRTKLPSSGDSPPAVHRSQLLNSPKTVPELLSLHGLQHYTSTLMEHGYDNLRYLPEVTESELHEIGITDEGEKKKLLWAFQMVKR